MKQLIFVLTLVFLVILLGPPVRAEAQTSLKLPPGTTEAENLCAKAEMEEYYLSPLEVLQYILLSLCVFLVLIILFRLFLMHLK